MPRSTGAMRASEKSPTAVRQRVLLSQPTLRRSTPITTTALSLIVRVDPEGAVSVRLVA
jgi:hypothetical protein